MDGVILRKYGEATTINFELFEVDGVNFRVDAADGGADCSIMKDEGAEATCTNDFVDEGTGYSLALTATEMEAARIVVYIIDATATKVWLDKAIRIETYGNASAQHAFDLDTATQSVNVAQISGDATAADNCESFFDGTGYAGTGNTIPTVTSVTNGVSLAAGAITNASLAGNMEIVFETDFATNYNTTRNAWVTNLQDTVGTGNLTADVIAISGDTTAADNLEADYDGTGYNKSASTIGTCTANTDMRGTDSAATAAALSTVDGNVDAILLDTNELQTDWANGGRLDLILDARASQATADAIETDTQNIQSRLPAALVSGRMDVDVQAINSSTTAAVQLALSANEIENGACEGTPTTTVIQTDLAETQDDIYIGRTVIFTSGNARGEATDITDYTGATGTLTVTALANAPAASDTFILI